MALIDENYDPSEELRGDIRESIEQQRGAAEPIEEVPAEASTEEAEPKDAGRDEKGRFLPKVEREAVEPIEAAPEAPKEAPQPKEAEKAPELGAVAQRPPNGFSVASKAEWDKLPQHVRDDIVNREQEISTGLQRYSGLKAFAEEAERNGRTLQAAVTDYVNVESILRRDPVAGVDFLCQKMNLNPKALAWAMGQRYGISGAEQAPPPPQQPQISPQAIAEYAANVVEQKIHQKKIDSDIEVFAADPKNKYFPNLRPAMAQIVQAGLAKDLPSAYEAACKLNPETYAIIINENKRNEQSSVAASRARNAAKSVFGSPSAEVTTDAKRERENMSTRDAILSAIAEQKGAL